MIKVFLNCSLTIFAFFVFSCKKDSSVHLLIPTKDDTFLTSIKMMDKAMYYDKVLGALVGSAIGDAMGAPTEMWHRFDIQKEYGYITGLQLVVREKSAEGIWSHNLDSGATTDDTRWKYLMAKYFTRHVNDLSVNNFTDFIVSYYQTEVKELSDKNILKDPDLLDEKIQKVDWIKEWARVALAYKKGLNEYAVASSRFYGGEMSCAGMLYSPMFGLINSKPETAYTSAYEHSIFDIGYARDITSLVAAMTQMAMQTDHMDDILKKSLLIDPHKYLDSRLIERMSLSITKDSRHIVDSSFELSNPDTINVLIPNKFQGSRHDWMRQKFVYDELEKRQKAIPFHAGEIWQILYTGLVFGGGDFQKTLEFVVNYGRDNDTVAAIAGMILGAKDGYNKLPKDMKETVLKVNREHIGIDLESLAHELTDQYYDIL